MSKSDQHDDNLNATDHDAPQAGSRRTWEEPKLEFVEPTLVRHGDMKVTTQGLIGTFVPED